jgi:hypothetical protein
MKGRRRFGLGAKILYIPYDPLCRHALLPAAEAVRPAFQRDAADRVPPDDPISRLQVRLRDAITPLIGKPDARLLGYHLRTAQRRVLGGRCFDAIHRGMTNTVKLTVVQAEAVRDQRDVRDAAP